MTERPEPYGAEALVNYADALLAERDALLILLGELRAELSAALALLCAIAGCTEPVERWPPDERAVVVPESLILAAIELCRGEREV